MTYSLCAMTPHRRLNWTTNWLLSHTLVTSSKANVDHTSALSHASLAGLLSQAASPCRCGRSRGYKEDRKLRPCVPGGDLSAWSCARHILSKALEASFLSPSLMYGHPMVNAVQGTAETQRGGQERVRKLMERQGQGAYPYARIFAILQISHGLLTLGVTASQRDVFYRQVPTSQVSCPCTMHSVPLAQ